MGFGRFLFQPRTPISLTPPGPPSTSIQNPFLNRYRNQRRRGQPVGGGVRAPGRTAGPISSGGAVTSPVVGTPVSQAPTTPKNVQESVREHQRRGGVGGIGGIFAAVRAGAGRTGGAESGGSVGGRTGSPAGTGGTLPAPSRTGAPAGGGSSFKNAYERRKRGGGLSSNSPTALRTAAKQLRGNF